MLKRTILLLAGLLVAGGCATSNPADAPPAAQTPVAVDTAPAAAQPTAAAAPTEASVSEAPAGQVRTFQIDPSRSKVSYEVGETLFREGNRYNLAIGTTNAVNGEITLDYATPSNSQVGTLTVDISSFKSDSDRRDSRIREEWLESARFPTVTFVPTGLSGLTDTVAEGQPVTFQVTGDTTIRDTTRPMTFDVTATLQGDELSGTAQTQFKMTDFGFQPPDIMGMLKAEDDVTIKIEFVALPQ
jgi:polyisoprenoid-binding protein YceI